MLIRRPYPYVLTIYVVRTEWRHRNPRPVSSIYYILSLSPRTKRQQPIRPNAAIVTLTQRLGQRDATYRL